MRKIDKHAEPVAHVEWRSKNKGDINYGYNLMDSGIRTIVKTALLEEQGWICAYTGRAINEGSSHIEHLLPQKAWQDSKGLDVDYGNLVACWPEPGYKPEPVFGARYKDNWPAPGEESEFVSPLSAACEKRFRFSSRGQMSADKTDTAAAKTMKRLGLDSPLLTDLRKIELSATLKNRSLKLPDARKRLKELEDAERELKSGSKVRLTPYCFALKQVLAKHIKNLENIRKRRKL